LYDENVPAKLGELTQRYLKVFDRIEENGTPGGLIRSRELGKKLLKVNQESSTEEAIFNEIEKEISDLESPDEPESPDQEFSDKPKPRNYIN
jgi:hypothetical protein